MAESASDDPFQEARHTKQQARAARAAQRGGRSAAAHRSAVAQPLNRSRQPPASGVLSAGCSNAFLQPPFDAGEWQGAPPSGLVIPPQQLFNSADRARIKHAISEAPARGAARRRTPRRLSGLMVRRLYSCRSNSHDIGLITSLTPSGHPRQWRLSARGTDLLPELAEQ